MVARQRAELTFGKHLAGGHQGHHSPGIKLSTCISVGFGARRSSLSNLTVSCTQEAGVVGLGFPGLRFAPGHQAGATFRSRALRGRF